MIHLVERAPPPPSQPGSGGTSADGGGSSSSSQDGPQAPPHDRNANSYVMLGTFNLPVNIMDPQQIQVPPVDLFGSHNFFCFQFPALTFVSRSCLDVSTADGVRHGRQCEERQSDNQHWGKSEHTLQEWCVMSDAADHDKKRHVWRVADQGAQSKMYTFFWLILYRTLIPIIVNNSCPHLFGTPTWTQD